ncbi:hypothetical protein [Nocardia mangyaensis]|uniref:hypothetical protein n=1 Tax=Nocardia mangyaensis TaxID=2213200 RepID=UPI002675CA5A|nr:hypothetical protein [Nocardia mangyaensis]MDO3645878.1 hypothetical protein [Nocardia mangyaensis]
MEAELTPNTTKTRAVEATVRLLGLVVVALPAAIVVAILLLLTPTGSAAKALLGLAMAAAGLCVVVCALRPPRGAWRVAVRAGFFGVAYPALAIAGVLQLMAVLDGRAPDFGPWLLLLFPCTIFLLHSLLERCLEEPVRFGERKAEK